jgi:hypothetical protein
MLFSFNEPDVSRLAWAALEEAIVIWSQTKAANNQAALEEAGAYANQLWGR